MQVRFHYLQRSLFSMIQNEKPEGMALKRSIFKNRSGMELTGRKELDVRFERLYGGCIDCQRD